MSKISKSVQDIQKAIAAASASTAQPARQQKKGATGRPFFKMVYDPCDGRPTQQWAGEKVSEFSTPSGVKMVEVRLLNIHTGAVSYYKINQKNITLTPVYEE